MGQNTATYISVPEAARRAEVANNTIRLAARNGKITAIKIARDWLIDPEDIKRWKEENYRPDKAYRFPVKPDDNIESS
jgi:excisionase family DNA binding protein